MEPLVTPVDFRTVSFPGDTGSAAAFTDGSDSVKKTHQRLNTFRPQNRNAKIFRGMD